MFERIWVCVVWGGRVYLNQHGGRRTFGRQSLIYHWFRERMEEAPGARLFCLSDMQITSQSSVLRDDVIVTAVAIIKRKQTGCRSNS